MEVLETSDCTDESRKNDTCLQLNIKIYCIKTLKKSLININIYEVVILAHIGILDEILTALKLKNQKSDKIEINLYGHCNLLT